LPGLSAFREYVHDEKNGNCKNFIEEKTNISAFFEPNTMEIKLDNNIMRYEKGSHIGGVRGPIPHRNTYIDYYYNRMNINLSKDFEFDILEGNNLIFNKHSYNSLVIKIDKSNTLEYLNVDQSGSTFIKKYLLNQNTIEYIIYAALKIW
jgi:hypothetical protein